MKKYLLGKYQIELFNNAYWLRKENMSHWKVFSKKQYEEKDILWLLFRLYKLCGAKYNYFKNNNKYIPVCFNINGEFIESNIVDMDGFKNINTNKVILLSSLLKISNVEDFETVMSKMISI